MAAVVSLSGYMSRADLERHVTGAPDEPPALLVSSEFDLDYIARQADPMRAHFGSRGSLCEAWWVPRANHFYPSHSVARRTDGKTATVEEAMGVFLAHALPVRSHSGRWVPSRSTPAGFQAPRR